MSASVGCGNDKDVGKEYLRKGTVWNFQAVKNRDDIVRKKELKEKKERKEPKERKKRKKRKKINKGKKGKKERSVNACA